MNDTTKKARELPELPEPLNSVRTAGSYGDVELAEAADNYYDGEQMREYAEAAVLAALSEKESGTDGCTEPNCQRCRTPPHFRGDMRHAGIGSYPQPASAMPSREALAALVEACEAEFCGPETEVMEPDDSKVSYPEDRCHITFGMIRRARAALSEKEQGGQAPVEYQTRGPRGTEWVKCDREFHESQHKAAGVETRALYAAPHPTSAVLEGYVLVPEEPTPAMLGAGLRHVHGLAAMPAAWRAMLAAAKDASNASD